MKVWEVLTQLSATWQGKSGGAKLDSVLVFQHPPIAEFSKVSMGWWWEPDERNTPIKMTQTIQCLISCLVGQELFQMLDP